MNRISNLLGRGARSLQRDTGNQKFVYEGQEYFCVPNTLERGEIVSMGGREYDVKLTLMVLQSAFPRSITADSTNVGADETDITADYDYPPPPRSGDKITFPAPPADGVTEYRVLNRRDSPDGSTYAFTLGDIDR